METDTWQILTPSLIVGTLLTAMIGMALSKLTGINSRLDKLNAKFYEHVTTPSIHEAAFARTDEQIKSLANIIKVAHHRIDNLGGET